MTLERRTYLDWNATAPLRAEARSAMFAALDLVGNPSSVHAEGRAARRLVEDAREKVAALVGAQPREVYFTSGATEANNWVHRRTWRTVFYSRLEHPSVVAPVEAGDGERIAIAARRSGEIDLEALERELAVRAAALADAPGQALLTLQTANNETGVVQPLAHAVRLAKAHRVLVVSDAVQAPGRIPVEFAGSGLAYLTLSAHKLGGPKGIGAVIARADAPLPPLLTGGGQERRHRAGTENVAAIAGFGAAAAEAMRDLAEAGRVAQLRDRLEQHVLAVARGAIVIGRGAPRLPNTSCLAVEGRSAETVVTALDLAGIAVSAGSACSSGKVAASPVLAAMGLEPGVARSAIRVSIGTSTTEDDIAAFAAAFEAITGRGAKAA
jgi:cysteine desulfurase